MRLAGAVAWLALLAAPPAALACPGDCDGDGAVTVDELIAGVNVLLGTAPLAGCAAADRDGDGAVTVAELIAAVGALQDGCALPPPCDVPGTICTIAGTGRAQFDGDGRAALDTSFYYPIALERDAAGRLLIMDWNNLRLRRLEPDGTVQTIMGTDVEDFPVDGALAIDTPLHHASDMELDPAGNLYVAGDHVPVVFRVGRDDRVSWIAGTDELGWSGDGGPARAARLTTPVAVLPDGFGGVFISDVDAHVVRHVDDAGIINTVAGMGRSGYAGDGGLATAALLGGPGQMQFGPDGALYWVERRNHVVRRLGADAILTTVAGTGARGFSGDGGPATAARLDSPYDLVFAPGGDLLIADSGNNVVRRIAPDGTISTLIGDGEPAFRGDGGAASAASLKRPSALLLLPNGDLLIGDTANQRVRRVAAPFITP